MEKELNISAILKDKPVGTKLWSPIFGNCVFSRLSGSGIRVFPIHNGFTAREEKSFFVTGQYTLAGEVCLFPSKQMRDWSKFAWENGDVLLNDDGKFCIFESFAHSSYSTFKSKLIKHEGPFKKVDTFLADTKNWHKASDDVAKEYIAEIGEVEEQPEFKDGDIITIEDTEYKAIIIYKSNGDFMFRSYAVIDNVYKKLGIDKIVNALGRCTRLATDSEKQQLFSALEKKGKRWDAENKQIVDLPKKCEFKPFDKVLVKIAGRTWTADFFSHYDENDEELPYVCIGYGRVIHCIPYNEETKHLLGTTDEWKGGE